MYIGLGSQYYVVLSSLLGLSMAGPYWPEPEYPRDIFDDQSLVQGISHSSDDDQVEDQEESFYSDYAKDQYEPRVGDGIMNENDMMMQNIRWQNEWDGDLRFKCSKGHGFNKVESVHRNYIEDRRWRFGCREVSLERVFCVYSGGKNHRSQ